MEKKVLSCGFNIDTACVEARYEGGSKLSIYLSSSGGYGGEEYV